MRVFAQLWVQGGTGFLRLEGRQLRTRALRSALRPCRGRVSLLRTPGRSGLAMGDQYSFSTLAIRVKYLENHSCLPRPFATRCSECFLQLLGNGRVDGDPTRCPSATNEKAWRPPSHPSSSLRPTARWRVKRDLGMALLGRRGTPTAERLSAARAMPPGRRVCCGTAASTPRSFLPRRPSRAHNWAAAIRAPCLPSLAPPTPARLGSGGTAATQEAPWQSRTV